MPHPARLAPQSHRGSLVSFLALLLFPLSATAAPNAAASSGPVLVHRLLHQPGELLARLTATSPDVGAARARVDQARAEVSASRLIPNPVLDVSLSAIPVSRANNASFASSNSWTIGLSQTIELGKRGPRAAAAEQRAHAAGRYWSFTLSERMAAARAAMVSALHLSLRGATLEGSLHDAEHATELERVRYEQKALSGMDYDRLLLELSSLRAEVERSHAEYESARAECQALLAGPCDLTGASEEDMDRALPISDLAARADLQNRPDLAGLLLEREGARTDAELARRRAIPDITLRVGYTRDNSAGPADALDSVSVGVQLPLPLSDHGQHDACQSARSRE